jgi:hypothetical protein
MTSLGETAIPSPFMVRQHASAALRTEVAALGRAKGGIRHRPPNQIARNVVSRNPADALGRT